MTLCNKTLYAQRTGKGPVPHLTDAVSALADGARLLATTTMTPGGRGTGCARTCTGGCCWW